MDGALVSTVAVYMLSLIFSLTVHEYGHALAGYLLGDDTAAREGRLTLNPLSHLDPVGSVLIPLLQLTAAATGTFIPLFGWARPVPFRAERLTRKITMRAGAALVALAGPTMNLLLGLLATIAYGALYAFMPDWLRARTTDLQLVLLLLQSLIAVNISLACFNLIPVPPLDGGWVFSYLLPERWSHVLELLGRYSIFMLIAALAVPPPLRLPAGVLSAVVAAVSHLIGRDERGSHWSYRVVDIAFPLSIVMLSFAGMVSLRTVLFDGAMRLATIIARLG